MATSITEWQIAQVKHLFQLERWRDVREMLRNLDVTIQNRVETQLNNIEKQKMQEAQQLVEHGQFEDARDILQKISHPKSQQKVAELLALIAKWNTPRSR